LAKIVALGEKQFFVFDFELAEIEELSLDLTLEQIVATLGDALNRKHLEAEEMRQLSAPLLYFLKHSQVYQAALQGPGRDGVVLTPPLDAGLLEECKAGDVEILEVVAVPHDVQGVEVVKGDP